MLGRLHLVYGVIFETETSAALHQVPCIFLVGLKLAVIMLVLHLALGPELGDQVQLLNPGFLLDEFEIIIVVLLPLDHMQLIIVPS